MRRFWWVLICFGCEPGVQIGGISQDMGADLAVIDVALPDPLPPTGCADFCLRYRQLCPQTHLIVDCSRCDDAVGPDDEHPEPHLLAAQACQMGLEQKQCGLIAACLSDDDGLTAIGHDIIVLVQGTLFEVPIELNDGAAVAAVRTKGRGGPSDLDLHFWSDGQYWRLRFDDLAISPGILNVADHVVKLDSKDTSVVFEAGQVDARNFMLAGPFTLTGELKTGLPGEILQISVEGHMRW